MAGFFRKLFKRRNKANNLNPKETPAKASGIVPGGIKPKYPTPSKLEQYREIARKQGKSARELLGEKGYAEALADHEIHRGRLDSSQKKDFIKERLKK